MATADISLGVSEFVALCNQTLEYAYPNVTLIGELANFRVSKNRWVYFDLKDDTAIVRFFGSVYQLPGPLEDGMMLAVRGTPRLHPLYGFSVTVQRIQPVGQGSIKKATELLKAKLAADGLFDAERKRPLPYPPKHIGLIASAESAAYRDFLKILFARWGGLCITVIDVQVQGEAATGQVEQAVAQFNQMAIPPDVLVVTRGGGSAEDLQVFSTERVTRAVASSRIPTVVAIGHEVDVSLAELAADQRASTPSNAAELLVPDRRVFLEHLHTHRQRLRHFAKRALHDARAQLAIESDALHGSAAQVVTQAKQRLELKARLLRAYDPQAALARGYALVSKGTAVVRSGSALCEGDEINIQFADARLAANVKSITINTENHHV